MNPYWQRRCELCGTAYEPLDEHHIYRKVNNRKVTVYVCRKCHQWIHNHPELAKQKGLYMELTTVDNKVNM